MKFQVCSLDFVVTIITYQVKMNEDDQMSVETTKEEAEENEFIFARTKTSLGVILDIVNNHSYVKVQVTKDSSYFGFMHSVDPVTSSVILSVPQGDAYKTVLIPGWTIKNFSLEDTPPNIKPPKKKETQTESTEDILKRKTNLISWFKTNLLPVTELNNKIIIGNVTLLPPYKISDISTDNLIVAMQIKNVIEKMPEDYEVKLNSN